MIERSHGRSTLGVEFSHRHGEKVHQTQRYLKGTVLFARHTFLEIECPTTQVFL